MSCCKTSVKGGQRVLNNGRGCSARGLPGDEVRLEDEAEHDALAKGKAPVRVNSGARVRGNCSGRREFVRASARVSPLATQRVRRCRPLEMPCSKQQFCLLGQL